MMRGDSPPCVISSVSEKSFSLTVKCCMRANESGKPDMPRMWDTVFRVRGIAELVRKRIAAKTLGCASDDDTGEAVQTSNPIPHPCFQT